MSLEDIRLAAYGLAAVLFILSLKGMSEVKTSRLGNWAGITGMLLGVVATIIAIQINAIALVVAAVVVGAIDGAPMALRMPMTAVPQRTAFSHAFGALAAALVGTGEFYDRLPAIIAHGATGQDRFAILVLCAEVIIGYLTATGSIVALLKLQEVRWVPSAPLIFPGRHLVSALLIGGALAIGVLIAIDPAQGYLFPYMIGAALIFGVLFVLAIGGADMPTVIAILNSYAGLSAVALGFVLNNKLLIIAGALDGSSGLVLAILMCRAMNRSFTNVLFGGFGAVAGTGGKKEERPYRSGGADEAAFLLSHASKVVFAPGYGLAVAQAQHAVRELAEDLKKQNIDVKYAIHPVAGRMPGHMNVLLADANVPYDELYEMDEINSHFPEVDVVVVVGANDVVNPAARLKKDSPLYGMPMLEVDRARNVIFLKRSMAAGFAGVDNELFYCANTMMLLGDAKKSLLSVREALKRV
jgi:H+-translocating NAD(P) transhydrogenase subunit beta